MPNTRDEILYAFAGILDIIPKPTVPTFGDQSVEPIEEEEEAEEEEAQEIPQLPIPITKPQEQVPEEKQISIRKEEVEREQKDSRSFDEPLVEQPWLLPGAGSAKWAAEYYPEPYLRGHAPFMGYASRTENEEITNDLMNRIVTDTPEKYFEWRLYRNDKFDKWQEKAARALIEKNPEHALIIDMAGSLPRSLNHLLPVLWNKMVGPIEEGGLGGTEMQRGEDKPWPGFIHKRMTRLIKKIQENVPNFYDKIEFTEIVQKFLKSSPELLRVPLSTREKPQRGSFIWLAEHYPQVYLKGIDDMGFSKGHRRERSRYYDALTNKTVNRLLDTNPIKFFEWGLNRPQDLQKYIIPAAQRVIQDNPYQALMTDLFKKPVIHSLLPELWESLVGIANKHDKDADWFPGYLANRMVSFWKIMKSRHLQFFEDKILGTPLHYKLEEADGLIRSKKWHGY